jgi:glycosyltransferase involved in cell wall biosynthesis
MKLYKPTKVTYVPHGIDPYIYRPIKEDDPGFLKFQKDLTISKEDYDFIVLYNNRNIRRKMPNDLLVAFKLMTNKLNKQQKDRTLLIYHTEPIDNHGTDLYASHQALCNECNVKFSTNKLSITQLNYLYNLADCTVGVSSAEGFGLATAESLMAGTPILINSIGGLQDQAGFVDEEGNEIEYSSDFPSNSCKRYTKHGK